MHSADERGHLLKSGGVIAVTAPTSSVVASRPGPSDMVRAPVARAAGAGRTRPGGQALDWFGKERPDFHNVVTWDRLAEVCGRYLGKGQQVAIEGRIQTRTWDDEKGLR